MRAQAAERIAMRSSSAGFAAAVTRGTKPRSGDECRTVDQLWSQPSRRPAPLSPDLENTPRLTSYLRSVALELVKQPIHRVDD